MGFESLARARLGGALRLVLIWLLAWQPAAWAAPSPTPEPVLQIDERDLERELPAPPPMAPATGPLTQPLPLTIRTPAPARLGGEAAAVLLAINAYRARLRLPPLQAAADLTQVAQEHCQDVVSHGFVDIDSPYRGSHQHRLWQAGISDPSPLSFALVFDQRQGAAAALAQDGKIYGSLQERDLSHAGIGLVTGANRRFGGARVKCLTIELANRAVALVEPQQQRFQPGDSVQLVGVLGQSMEAPQVIVMPPTCGTLHPAVEGPDARGVFRAQVPLEAKGEYVIEVMANGPLGPVLTNLLPVYVGVPPPAARATYDQARAGTAQSGRAVAPGEVRRLMLTLINQDRARCGLQPVQYSAELEKLAQGHSEDMRQNRYFAHVSPTQGNLRQRATAHNIHFLKIGENLAINTSVREAHRNLMLSPAHRSMILDPDVDYVGVGVIQANDPVYGKGALWITQNYARFMPQ